MPEPLTILVIDDDPMMRSSLLTEKLAHRRPDAVITDIVMPEHEGIETIVALRAAAPNLPIIAISGCGQVIAAEFLDMALQAGATATLRKPFELATLLATLARLLQVPRTKHSLVRAIAVSSRDTFEVVGSRFRPILGSPLF